MPYIAGETLLDRYRIVNLLGQGTSGAVYRAYDVRDRRDVAIKEYLDPSIETQQLFRREARRLAQHAHPQRPTWLDHFAISGVGQYLVSSYVDGVDLQTLIDQYGPLPTERIVAWLQAACEPLADLHRHGTVHLNLKPANIRLTPDGRVFLVDTGLPGLGTPVGGGGTVAPEQQKQGAVDARTDIYAMGATLYALLTGREPAEALRREAGLDTLANARDLNPDVEPYLALVASRALSLRPDARYAGAAEFARALERPTGGVQVAVSAAAALPPRRTADPTPTLPPPRAVHARRRQMQRRTIWALSAILLAVTALGISLGLVNRDLPVGVTQAEATATVASQVVAALTELAPTPTLTPTATPGPTPTPEPIVEPQTGARMVFVPSGIFRLGNDDGEPDEQPAYMVQLDGLYLDQTEVTNAAYALCVDAGACTPPLSPNATTHPSYYGDPAYDDFPVIFVNWSQAETFCAWRGARLPTEAEWEYAAGYDPRTATKLLYPWGAVFDGTALNYCDTRCAAADRDPSADDGHADTAPVGAFPAGTSPFGLYDMSGNVWEWVNDWYNPTQYAARDNANPFGPVSGEARVIRGGSWLSTADESTTTFRGRFLPEVARANVGFRCARTLD